MAIRPLSTSVYWPAKPSGVRGAPGALPVGVVSEAGRAAPAASPNARVLPIRS